MKIRYKRGLADCMWGVGLTIETLGLSESLSGRVRQALKELRATNKTAPIVVLTASPIAGLQLRRAVSRELPLFNVDFTSPSKWLGEFSGSHPKAAATFLLEAARASLPAGSSEAWIEEVALGANSLTREEVAQLRLHAEGQYRDLADAIAKTQELLSEFSTEAEAREHALEAATQGMEKAAPVIAVDLGSQLRDLLPVLDRYSGSAPVKVIQLACETTPLDPRFTPRPSPKLEPENAGFLLAIDAVEEVREAFRLVLSWADQGVPLDQCAIFYTRAGLYEPLLLQLQPEMLKLAGINRGPTYSQGVARQLLQFVAAVKSGLDRRSLQTIFLEIWDTNNFNSWSGFLHSLTYAARPVDCETALYRKAERKSEGLEEEFMQLKELVESIDLASWRSATDGLSAALRGGHFRREGVSSIQEQVDAALARIAELDQLSTKPDWDAIHRVLESELSRKLAPETPFGNGLFCSPLDRTAGFEFQKVCILGLSADSFPPIAPKKRVFPNRLYKAAGLEPPDLEEEVRWAEHYLERWVCSGSEVWLSSPEASRKDQRVVDPSAAYLKALSDCVGRAVEAENLSSELGSLGGRAVHVQEYSQSLRAVVGGTRLPLSSGEIDRAGMTQFSSLASRSKLAPDARPFKWYEGWQGAERSAFCGQLEGFQIPGEISVSNFEALCHNPFDFFLRGVLRLRDEADESEFLEIAPLERGSIVHKVLAALVDGKLKAKGSVEPDDVWSEGDFAEIAELLSGAIDESGALSFLGETASARELQRGLELQLQRFLRAEQEFRAKNRLRIVRVESEDDGYLSETWKVPSAAGELTFRGKLDRVDQIEGAEDTVPIDYKVGRHNKNRHGMQVWLYCQKMTSPKGYYLYLGSPDELTLEVQLASEDLQAKFDKAVSKMMTGEFLPVFEENEYKKSDPFGCLYPADVKRWLGRKLNLDLDFEEDEDE
ncbi:MAG: PD-(D/E)XK nuclease family protein [Fimbriimonadaceae bacterium]